MGGTAKNLSRFPELKVPGHEHGKRYTVRDLRTAAGMRGGRCLSGRYGNIHTKLLWECADGHRWYGQFGTVLRGSWCPECAGVRRKTLGEMRVYARSLRGRCLSERYVNMQTALEWECRRGHRWTAAPDWVLRGKWCPFCSGVRKSLADAQQLARFRGGSCVSKEYVNARRPLDWRCGTGHTWEARYDKIRQGDWCPYCSGRRMTIADMRKAAGKRNGRCLSDEYVNNHTHLIWECREKHRWPAAWCNIQRGRWCPVCARENAGMLRRKRQR